MSPQPLEVEGPAGAESKGSCWVTVGLAAVRLPGTESAGRTVGFVKTQTEGGRVLRGGGGQGCTHNLTENR